MCIRDSFVPDKEVALTFVFLLGYYPLAKPYFERIRPALLRAVCKLLLCNGGILAMYGLVLLLVPAGSIAEELRTTALAVSLVTLAMGNAAFLLYDRALHNMLTVSYTHLCFPLQSVRIAAENRLVCGQKSSPFGAPCLRKQLLKNIRTRKVCKLRKNCFQIRTIL